MVTNTLVDEDGIPASSVVVQIVLLSSTFAPLSEAFDGNVEINPNHNLHADVEGTWTLNLFPNAQITPAGTVYQVTHVLPAGDQVVRFVVPVDGATPSIHPLSTLVVG